MVSVHKAIGTVRVPFEIHGVATGISQTILREKIVVCPVIPSRAGPADIRGTEPLGKRPLFDRPAHAADNFSDRNLRHLRVVVVV